MTTARERGEGAIVARYRLERRLGEGGFGEVWAATHVVTRRRVALKFLKEKFVSDDRARQRFLREARAASAVSHPNVIVIHDVFEDDGVPIMVMDLLEGESLGARLRRDPTMSLAEVATVMVPVISAVHAAHLAGVLHRDLKPDNIFLTKPSYGAVGGPEVRVLDFGIAKLTDPESGAERSGRLTHSDTILGTPFYMSPEQFFGDGEIDDRSDVWAIGVIVYECLAGVRPTEAKTIAHVVKVIMAESIVPLAQLRPDLPQEVADVVMRALSFDCGKRPAIVEIGRVLSPYALVRSDLVATLISGPAGAAASPVSPRRRPTSAGGHPAAASEHPARAGAHAVDGRAESESLPATQSPSTVSEARSTVRLRTLRMIALAGGGAASLGLALMVWRPRPISTGAASMTTSLEPAPLRSPDRHESSAPAARSLAALVADAAAGAMTRDAVDAGATPIPAAGLASRPDYRGVEPDHRGPPGPAPNAKGKPRVLQPADPGSIR